MRKEKNKICSYKKSKLVDRDLVSSFSTWGLTLKARRIMWKEMKASFMMKPGDICNPEPQYLENGQMLGRSDKVKEGTKDAHSGRPQENMVKHASSKYRAHPEGKCSEPPYLEQWVQLCGLMAGVSLDSVWPEGEAEKTGPNEKFTQTNHKSWKQPTGEAW